MDYQLGAAQRLIQSSSDCWPDLALLLQLRQSGTTWVKVKGQWLYKTRQIASGSNPPEGWKE